jgi:hypothetical protein
MVAYRIASQDNLLPQRSPRRKGWARLIGWLTVPVLLSLVLVFLGWVELAEAHSEAALYKEASVSLSGINYAKCYWIAGCEFVLAAVLIILPLIRFARLWRVARHGEVTAIPSFDASMTSWRIRLSNVDSGGTIEWQVMKFPGEFLWKWMPGYRDAFKYPCKVLGDLKSGRLIVVQTYDNRLLWPAARSQLVVGTASYGVPSFAGIDDRAIVSHHRLLAVYAQVIRQLNELPLLIRYPLDDVTSSWWWLGAPRFLVVWLASWRIRRCLVAMRNALSHKALLTEASDGDGSRHRLREASKECQELIGTLPRSTVLTVLVATATIALPVYTAFFVTPHFAVSDGVLLGLFLLWVVAGCGPLMVLRRSAGYVEELFNAPLYYHYSLVQSGIQYPSGSNVGEIEKDAFRHVGERVPRGLQGQPRIFWILLGIYTLSTISTLLFVVGFINVALLIMFVAGVVFFGRIAGRRQLGLISGFRALYGQVNKSFR